MKEEKLKQIWEKHINRPLYRVISKKDFKIIKKEGLNPEYDPYEEIKPKLKALLKIVQKLKVENFDLCYQWGKRKVDAEYALKVTIFDLNLSAIDFTPNKSDIKYYMNFPGGAANTNLKRLTREILRKKQFLL